MTAAAGKPKLLHVYLPVEDAKLKRLLKESEATGLTVEQLIQGRSRDS
jgi:hypothetical protein